MPKSDTPKRACYSAAELQELAAKLIQDIVGGSVDPFAALALSAAMAVALAARIIGAGGVL